MHLKPTLRSKAVLLFVMVTAIAMAGCVSPNAAQTITPLATSVNAQPASFMDWSGTKYCVALYQHREFLLIVTSDKNTDGKISIYDPRLGVAYSGYFRRRAPKAGCQIEGEPWAVTYNNLSLILSPEFKALFSAAAKQSTALAQAITAGPPYFRYDSNYMGKMSGVNSIGYMPSDLKLEAAEDWLRRQTPERIQLIFADTLDVLSRQGH